MALVCAGFSAFVLIFCVVAGVHFKSGTEIEFYRETGNIAQMLLASFEDDAADADAILSRLAAQLPSDTSTASEADLHQVLKRYELRSATIGPAVIDRNGISIASALTYPVPRISLSDRSVFRIHADNPHDSQLYISPPTRGQLTNEWAIQFSRPLQNAAGDFQGVLLSSLRLSHFAELYEKLKLSDRGLAALTGFDGVVRIRSMSRSIAYGYSVSKIAQVYKRVIDGEKSGTFYGRSQTDDVVRLGTFLVSTTTPLYVTVGYDEDYLRSQYIGFFYMLALCWFVLTAAMVAALVFIRSLDTIRQRNQLEVVKSAILERQNISADMHDSIGASLATLLAHFTANKINPGDAKRRIGEILMELRFLVDSAEPIDGELDLVLSNVRHRMGSGIELAGIDLRWQVSELPKIPRLTTRDALSIKLVLMEALSNILHHSKAKTAALMAGYDEPSSAVLITIHDDGCGFHAADITRAGRGISNMRKRIRSISIGGTLGIDSSPGKGTTIRIELKVPPASGTATVRPRETTA